MHIQSRVGGGASHNVLPPRRTRMILIHTLNTLRCFLDTLICFLDTLPSILDTLICFLDTLPSILDTHSPLIRAIRACRRGGARQSWSRVLCKVTPAILHGVVSPDGCVVSGLSLFKWSEVNDEEEEIQGEELGLG